MKKTSTKASPAGKKTATSTRTPPAAVEKTANGKKSAARKTPSAVKRASSTKSKAGAKETVITARADVGLGNELFLRGDGPGLSWDRGVLMSCTDSDCWSWRSTNAEQAFEFKVLINDEQWSNGENWTISPGESKELAPEF